MTATYSTATDQYIDVLGIKLAYRHVGQIKGIPLLLNIHFRGTMDHWDPLLIDSIAAKRPVILFDNAGVGRSQGTVPESYAQWAEYARALMKALGFTQYDVLGFSMGSFVAQLMALQDAKAVRKIILAGGAPSAGEGVQGGEDKAVGDLIAATTQEEHHKSYVKHFFKPTPAEQEKGEQWWKRMTNARSNRSDYLDDEATAHQKAALMHYLDPANANDEDATYNRLDQLRLPVLIATGSGDVLIPTWNSIILWQRLVNAPTNLHLYPHSGHGFLNEYAEHFAGLANDFLDGKI